MPLFGPPNVEKLKASQDIRGLIKALGYSVDKDPEVFQEAMNALVEIGEPAVEDLVDALHSRKWIVQERACKTLGEMGSRASKAVPELIKLLQDDDMWVYMAAADALGAIGDPRAIDPLIEAFDHVGWPAAKVLGNIKDERVVEPLIKLLDSGKMVGVAVNALGETGDERAIEPLTKMIHTYHGNDITNALDKCGWKPDKSSAAVWYFIIRRQWDECARLGDSAVEPLIKLLSTSELKTVEDRIAAVRALALVGEERAIEPIQREFDSRFAHSTPELREAAKQALDQLSEFQPKKPRRRPAKKAKKSKKPSDPSMATYRLTKTSLGNPLNLEVTTKKHCVYCRHISDPNLRDPQFPKGVGGCSNQTSGYHIVNFDDTCPHWKPNERVRFWLSKGYMRFNREGWPKKPWYQVFDDGPDGKAGTQ